MDKDKSQAPPKSKRIPNKKQKLYERRCEARLTDLREQVRRTTDSLVSLTQLVQKERQALVEQRALARELTSLAQVRAQIDTETQRLAEMRELNQELASLQQVRHALAAEQATLQQKRELTRELVRL